MWHSWSSLKNPLFFALSLSLSPSLFLQVSIWRSFDGVEHELKDSVSGIILDFYTRLEVTLTHDPPWLVTRSAQRKAVTTDRLASASA